MVGHTFTYSGIGVFYPFQTMEEKVENKKRCEKIEVAGEKKWKK